MKSGARILVVAIISLVAAYGAPVHAQVLQDSHMVTAIGLYHLELSDNKTTNVLFPYAVKNVDRGSADVIAQTVQGFGNVLQLKANVAGFRQTNVTVITSDGKFYSFLVDYNSNPELLNLSFVGKDGESTGPSKNIALSDEQYNEAVLDRDATNLLSARSFLHKHSINEQMDLRLAGIYLKDGLMWFKLSLSNQSQVDYELNNIAFSVVDRKQAKRTARQELQLQPVYVKRVVKVPGNATKVFILAFKPITIPSTQSIKIQVSEKAGGRNLILSVKARKLLRARALKE